MKKNLISYMMAAVAAATLSACSLEETMESNVDQYQFYKNKTEIVAGLNGCYIPIRAIYNAYAFEIMTEGCTDVMYIPSGTQDAQLDVSPANPRVGNTVWQQGYTAVRNANYCIAGIERSNLSETDKKPLLAEAKTLRAFAYYLLTCVFGDVPFYEDVVDSPEKMKRIQRLPRMSAFDTRKQMVDELVACVGDMKQGRAYDVDGQRVGASCAYMLIGKMAMWNKDWETARDAMLKLVEFYGPLTNASYPISDNWWSVKNTPESIFEIQHTYTAGGLTVTATVCAAMMPYSKKAIVDENGETVGYLFDGVPVPELGDLVTAYAPYRPNVYFYQGLMPLGGGDLRAETMMVRDWPIGSKTYFSSVGSSGRPFMGPRFWCFGMTSTYDSNNYPVFRYADAVLMLSECYLELNDTDNYLKYLNQVKERAGITPAVAQRTKIRMLDELQKERARELLGEFQRKFDLVRWGIWYKATFENTDYAKLKEKMRPCHEYYPIPDTEVGLSGGALDNKAYDAYIDYEVAL